MNYFDYQVNQKMNNVWDLFEELGNLSEEEILDDNALRYLHTTEIIQSAMGRNINKNEWNLAGYEKICSDNDMKQQFSEVEKCVAIWDRPEDSKGDAPAYGTVDANTLKSRVSEVEIEALEDDDAFQRSTKDLETIRSVIIINNGIDIVPLLLGVLAGYKESIEDLKSLVKENKGLSDLVKNLCAKGNSSLEGYLTGLEGR